MRNSLDLPHKQYKTHDEKQSMGSISDKFPVILNDGRTIIFISDKSKTEETRQKYEMLKYKKFPTRNPRHQR